MFDLPIVAILMIMSLLVIPTNQTSKEDSLYYPDKTSYNFRCSKNSPLSKKYNYDKGECLKNEFGFRIIQTRPIKIGVIDTGIDRSHYYLKEHVSPKGYDLSSEHVLVNDRFIPDEPRPFYDMEKHGTHVAGIIVMELEKLSDMSKVYVPFEIISIKYYSSNGESNMNEAIDKVIFYEDVDILNISATGKKFDREELKLLKMARSKNIQIVTTSGNGGQKLTSKKTTYPCSYDLENIICVGSHDLQGTPSKSSNSGHRVDIGAMGESVTSTYNAPYHSWITMSGTSMAAPKVTAALAYYKVISQNSSYLSRNDLSVISNSSHKKFTFGNLDLKGLTSQPLKDYQVKN